ncbi:hypothetical protein [Actinopolymorpha pittospori]|uniref:Uncharacterized protein n=1 Tax=Actinopolymorpha pittospori TaxID=648752 RepID=A0A927REJ5_9ACTN|nr:hypothetical protein [Actinopolymorpha pittospori]MBE1612244.1 hypothetical protein [Actinopolymorpha pittospori]
MTDHGGTSEQLWTVRARVLERPPRPPTACHTVLTSDPPAGCSGVEVVGLDPRTVPGAAIHRGGTVFTPTLRLTGRYDGGRLVLTQPPTLVQRRAYATPPVRRRTGSVPAGPGAARTIEAAPSDVDLAAIRERLHADAELADHGIAILGSGQAGGQVLLWVVVAGPEQTEFLLDRYGPHLVVEGWLEPVPPR